jgi:hypothetical protein
MIRFVPDEETHAPMAGAPISDGKYSVDSHGGVPVGTHKIQIEAYRTVGLKPGARVRPSVRGDGVRQQYLSAKYNVNTTLDITIQPGAAKVTKDFDLKD